MKRTNEQHHYGPVFEVSAEAHQEKHRNWRECHGWAYGDAYVEHPDWQAVYADLEAHDERDYVLAGHGAAYSIVAKEPDGTLAHIGGICRSYANGKIILSG